MARCVILFVRLLSLNNEERVIASLSEVVTVFLCHYHVLRGSKGEVYSHTVVLSDTYCHNS